MGVRKYRGQIVCDVRWPDGKRFTRVCANRTKAKKLYDKVKGAIAEGTWQKLKENLMLRNREVVTLREFTDTYMEEYAASRNKRSTQVRKKTAFKFLNEFMGDQELKNIQPILVHKYVRKRNRDGRSERTINRELTALRNLLDYATECNFIDYNPIDGFKNLKEETTERRRFSDAEVDSVINRIRVDCRPLFVFIRETGCRREEALSLQHWQVHEESKLVLFSKDRGGDGSTKSLKFRYVPLTNAALAAVKALPPLEGCPYVFYNATSRTRWCECRKPWEKARVEAKVPDLTVKDLRRHYAIKLAESGAAMHDIQQVLGHESVSTTEDYYAHFSPDHSAKKILKVLEGGKRQKADEDEKVEKKTA